MMIATGMRTRTGYMTRCNLRNQVVVICSQDSVLHGNFGESELCSARRRLSLSVENESYSASFGLLANVWLAFWLFLVASSYFLLRRNVKFFNKCVIKPAEKVALPDRTIPNARTENDSNAVNSKFSCFESSRSCHKCDAYSKISDLDRASYWDSLLSLEEEDAEWLSDSKPIECSFESPSTPLSYKCDSLSEISFIFSPSYWDSLLRLEEKDSEWISDSKQELGYVLDGSVSTVSSDMDRASYWDSLLSLEEEDTEWLSDSFENPSTPLSYKCDSLSEISDLGSPSYWDSLLRLEEENSDYWISHSKQELESYKESWGVEVLSSVTAISSLNSDLQCNRSEDNISEEFSAVEPLFWPFEEELNWNSEESWSSFCSSPRRRLVFDSRSPTSRISKCKQEDHDDDVCSVKSETSGLSMWSKSSAKIVPLECENENILLKTFLAENFASNKDLPLGWEYIALDQELPIETLLGLKEFDGHEGLDSEFNSYVLMLD